MVLLTPKDWTDYELIDSGNGKRLERFGKYILARPDPQCLWKPTHSSAEWQKADAVFESEGREKGHWIKKNSVPNSWQIGYSDLKFSVHLSPFKHTGIFPEQAVHWEFVKEMLEVRSVKLDREVGNETKSHNTPQNPASRIQPLTSKPKVLNLFGYTGIASLAAASSGAEVTHVDASYPTIGWARENQKLSSLDKAPIRWILDDCLKFVEREVRRGNKYDGIIMDPPVYGHGPKGEKWDFNVSFPKLLALCIKLLSDKKVFLIINAYAVSASSVMLENMLKDSFEDGNIESGELVLEEKSGKKLSTGIFARWSK
jgi:23S rRNA (cytosine1962-C5)-methyltransferase